jgi:exosortase/archaeosortase family protein
VPTDMTRAVTPARSYALRLIAWWLALFGLLRLPWVGGHILLPVTRLQAAAGAALVGPSSLAIEATLACSGADALALCLASIVAYPARWRMRATGVAGGAAIVLALNTMRIGTLGRAAESSRWFDVLHVYVWPSVLTIAIAGFVFTWMRVVDRSRSSRSAKAWRFRSTSNPPSSGDARRSAQGAEVAAGREARLKTAPDPFLTRRFALVAATFLLLFTLASPLYLESANVLALAAVVAHAGAFLLRVVGVDAASSAGVLATPRGAFLVTQECISTPLIPVYLAAVLVYSRTWWTKALWTAACVPLFVGLGIARLLVVAVPGLDTSPAFFIHTFSQFLVAAGMVCGLALWRYGARAAAFARAVAALALAIAFGRLFGATYTHAISWFRTAAPVFDDAQGALTFLPAFQFGLFLALWVAAFVPSGWTRFLCGASLLAALQIAVADGVQLLAVHAGFTPVVRDIRAWALLGPALVIAAVVNAASPRR